MDLFCTRKSVGIFRLLLSGLLLSHAGVGCKNVEFYERERLIDPVMAFDPDPTETHFYQKVFYSREGSAGGIGSTAGGGCGCY